MPSSQGAHKRAPVRRYARFAPRPTSRRHGRGANCSKPSATKLVLDDSTANKKPKTNKAKRTDKEKPRQTKTELLATLFGRSNDLTRHETRPCHAAPWPEFGKECSCPKKTQGCEDASARDKAAYASLSRAQGRVPGTGHGRTGVTGAFLRGLRAPRRLHPPRDQDFQYP